MTTYTRVVITPRQYASRARAILRDLDIPHRREGTAWVFQPREEMDERLWMDDAIRSLVGYSEWAERREIPVESAGMVGVGIRYEYGPPDPTIELCPEAVDWTLEPAGRDLPYRTDGPGDRHETWSDDPWWMGYGPEGE